MPERVFDAADGSERYENRRGVYKIEKYRSCEAIIIDSIRRQDATNTELLKHFKANERITELFREHTNYRVRNLQLPVGSRLAAWHEFWDEKLSEKGKGDLLVLYYHGRAHGSGPQWKWLLKGYPRRAVNAYKLIHKINQTQVDCLLILDCWMPTHALKWRRKVEEFGNTELFSKGETVPDQRDNLSPIDASFTKALVRNTREYVQRVQRSNTLTPQSILELMSSDKGIISNPQRVWLNKPRHPHREKITRIKFLPWQIRATGKLEFFCFHVQRLEQRYMDWLPVEPQPVPIVGGVGAAGAGAGARVAGVGGAGVGGAGPGGAGADGDGDQGEDEAMDDGGVVEEAAVDEGVVMDVEEAGEEGEVGEKQEPEDQDEDNKNDDNDDDDTNDNDGSGLFVSQRDISQGGGPLILKSPSPEL